MHDTIPPSLSSSGRGRSGDDLDGLLSAFFQRQMPDPWPTVTVPETQSAVVASPNSEAPRKGASLWKSRALTLAASVAILIIVPWMLPADVTTGGSVEQPSASIPRKGPLMAPLPDDLRDIRQGGKIGEEKIGQPTLRLTPDGNVEMSFPVRKK